MNIYLNGEVFKEERPLIEVTNPANGALLGTIPDMNEKDIDLAVDAAREAYKTWGKMSQRDRSNCMEKAAALIDRDTDELAKLLSQENGKTVAEAAGEIAFTALICKQFAELANHLYGNTLPKGSEYAGDFHNATFTRRDPVGVFVGILPFNYPPALFAYKLAPALTVGNTVICKPPTDCPLAVIKMVELFYEAGVPRKALQIVTGRGSGCVGDYLSGHPGINMISVTGSVAVGTRIYQNAAKNLTRVFCELGANDAFIVLDDADVDLAAKEVIGSRVANNGQICCGSKRFLIHKDVKEEFIKKLIGYLESDVRMGDPADPNSTIGCLISEKAAIRVEEQVNHTISQGARLICGGKRDGAFYGPTILTDVTKDMDVAKDMEIFGPVVPIIEISSDEEALEIVNQCSFGLSGGVFSRDLKRAMTIASNAETCTMVINGGSDCRSPELAFGGFKKSGIGREGISRTLEEMTQEKNFVLKNVW